MVVDVAQNVAMTMMAVPIPLELPHLLDSTLKKKDLRYSVRTVALETLQGFLALQLVNRVGL